MTARIHNFTEFFKEPREIYIQNMSGKQISMAFDLGSGRSQSFLIPALRDPINLTQHIPWDAIKSSTDLRRLLNKSTELIRLLEYKEAMDYYKARAESRGYKTPDGKPDVEMAQREAEDKSDAIRNRRPLPDAPQPTKIEVKHEPTNEIAKADVIRPQLLQLINQVSNPDIAEKDLMPAKQLLDELEGMPNLTGDELEYIRAHGRYKTVKNWARELVSKVVSKEIDA